VPRPPFPRLALLGSVALLVTALSSEALAFERQWHFGGGAGVALGLPGLELGPALGVHAAYGLSDVFDVRLELSGSRHAHTAVAGAEAQPAVYSSVYTGKIGIAYKLDVIQWIPYLGVTAGALGATGPLPDYNQVRMSLGAVGGLDYAITRNLGIGIVGTADYVLTQPSTHAVFLLRAEYRFGW